MINLSTVIKMHPYDCTYSDCTNDTGKANSRERNQQETDGDYYDYDLP